MSYIGNEPIVSATRTVTEVTATAGQTTFTANGGYTVGYIDVFVNGAQLQSVDFTATNGSTIVLTEAAQSGDVIRLVAWGTFQTSTALNATNPSYSGTLTGGTGVVNLGSGQFYKDASGNVGIGTSSPSQKLDVANAMQISFGGSDTYCYFQSTSNYVGRATSGDMWVNAAGGQNINFGVAGTAIARVQATGSNFQFNSGYGSVATAYGCRAWVNFNGTGTVAIRASGNVSSITDNGAGDYTINFSTAMPDANYSTSWSSNFDNTTNNWFSDRTFLNYSTSSVRIYGGNGGSVGDSQIICAQIFR